jgi:hypothetical protein
MLATYLLGLVLAAAAPAEPPSPLRTDPPPKEWRREDINGGLPFHWEPGTVHVLAWETLADDRPFQYTQVLVLKHFDRPTEKGGHRWVLVHLYRHPDDKKRPWRGPLRVPPPQPPGEPEPELTEAQLYGWEFYDDPPTDEQVQAFLQQTDWTPTLGTDENSIAGDRPVTTSLTAGGVDAAVWKKVLGREVPARLFPELQVRPHE